MGIIKGTLLLCLLGLSNFSEAGPADYFDIYNVPNRSLNFGTWSIGMGAQARTATFCIASSNYSNAFSNPPPDFPPPAPAAQHENYKLVVLSRYSKPGYFFYLDRDDGNVGNARLAFTLEHMDASYGMNWEEMVYGFSESHAHKGQFKNCNNGKNSSLRVTLPLDQLENARAGVYRAKLRIEGTGGFSQMVADADNFRADIVVAEIVRASGLSDIPFGVHNPGSDQVGERTFCVYSNNATAGYSVTVTSPNQVAGAFFLSGTADTIPYDVYLKSDTSAGFGTPVGSGPIPGVGNNSSSSCGGADNAKLSVSINDMEIVASKSGSYSDTLTLLVAPN